MMSDRILAVSALNPNTSINVKNTSVSQKVLAACICTSNSERTVANCLARLAPFVSELLVLDDGSEDRTIEIAKEYHSRVICLADKKVLGLDVGSLVESDWWFLTSPQDTLTEDVAKQMISFVSGQPEFTTEVVMSANGDSSNHVTPPLTIRFWRSGRSLPSNAIGLTFRQLDEFVDKHKNETAWLFGKGPSGLSRFKIRVGETIDFGICRLNRFANPKNNA